MKPNINFDMEKLTNEDRRFLMSRSLSVASTNATINLANTSLIISFISGFIAVFSLVFSIQREFNNVVLIVLDIELIFVIFLLMRYSLAQKKSNNQKMAAEKGHNLLFKKHFEYAEKK